MSSPLGSVSRQSPYARRRSDETSGRQDRSADWLRLTAQVDGRRVYARWHVGALVVHPLLQQRAQLLVDLEEPFVYPDLGVLFSATLAGPSRDVLLTLIRACTAIVSVDLGRGAANGAAAGAIRTEVITSDERTASRSRSSR